MGLLAQYRFLYEYFTTSSYHVNRIKHRLAYASYLGDFRYRTILLLVRTMGDYRVQLYVLVQGLYDSS